MSRLNNGNGRAEPEVIMNYQDGLSYSRAKLEAAFREGGILEKPPAKAAKETFNVKRDDVDLIMNEFGISKAQAEKALAAHGADVEKTLRALVSEA